MKKNNIVLDLDQTLIYGEPVKDFNNTFYSKASKFTFHDMDKTYVIFERPNLQDFLDFIFKNFKVSVWTAASKDYALFVISNVILKNKPERKLEYIFVSYHCRISEKTSKGGYTKDLQLLWNKFNIPNLSFKNTFIIDDYKSDVYASQPKNCILAPEFIFRNKNSENDNFLSNLILKMKHLVHANDVQTVIPKINSLSKTEIETNEANNKDDKNDKEDKEDKETESTESESTESESTESTDED